MNTLLQPPAFGNGDASSRPPTLTREGNRFTVIMTQEQVIRRGLQEGDPVDVWPWPRRSRHVFVRQFWLDWTVYELVTMARRLLQRRNLNDDKRLDSQALLDNLNAVYKADPDPDEQGKLAAMHRQFAHVLRHNE